MKNKLSLLFVLIAALFVSLPSCKKDTTEADKNKALELLNQNQQRQLDSLRLIVATDSVKKNYANGNIYYTVQVVAAENLTGKTDGLSGADVYANQNGVITKVTTDGSGQAAFNLRNGNVAVSVVSNNHTTVNYIVQLDGTTGSAESYASTIVAVFPLSGNGTATITGGAYAELDQTNTVRELAPDGTRVNAYIEQSQLLGYLNHSLPGKLVRITYESSTFTSTVQAGRYTLTVPASARGLNLVVSPVDFEYNVTVSALVTQRHVFHYTPFTENATSNGNIVQDFTYN